jgi:cytochrome b subunit of formate dehydrogenase
VPLRRFLVSVKVSSRILLRTLALFLLGSALPIRAQHKIKDVDCLTCHGDATLSKDVNGKQVSLFVDGKKLQHSIHGSMKLACVDCHKDVKSLAHETPPQKVLCVSCHAKASDAHALSTHAKVDASGKILADCLDCHGDAHAVLAGGHPDSPINHAHIPATCGRCHGQKFLMESNGVSTQPFLSYQESVHGRAVGKGSTKAAVCTDCHGAHAILPANDPKSPIYKFSVPATCGQCHTDIQNTFSASIHGQAIARGNLQSPVCTDCHGIHSIKSHKDSNSPVAAQNLSRDTCARCHEGVRLSSEFGVPGNRVSTYLDSYHGLASEGGSVVAANCSSCHGVHNILPSSDSRSTINYANLDATCGQCHKGVTQKFTLTPVHLADGVHPRDVGTKITRWVRIIYTILILGIIGSMFLHNFVIWRSKAAARRQMHNPMMQRMSVNQRWQHLALLTSFIVLVLTGFALKYPNSWFADLLAMGEHVRSIVHRIAGVVLIAAGFYHVFYLAIANEGRRMLRDIAPTPKDLTDVFGTMRYYLGFGGTKPKFGRFTYGEKAEYWALVWGTALMGVTGVMMWAKVWVGNLLARWWVDVATAVHFYEAILATLAIIVWHFYQVFGDPDVYPMNWAWWDGKMSVEHYRHEHELDTDATPITDVPPNSEK